MALHFNLFSFILLHITVVDVLGHTDKTIVVSWQNLTNNTVKNNISNFHVSRERTVVYIIFLITGTLDGTDQ